MKHAIIISILVCSAAFAADEIQSFNAGATTCFAVVRELDGDVWYVVGQVFEVWGTGARTAADYDIALTSKSGGMFVGNFDSNISAGYYYIVSHQQAAGAPADTDPATWAEYGYWDGTNWQPNTMKTIEDKIDTVDTVVDAIKAKTDNLPADPADDSDIDAAIAALNDLSAADVWDAVCEGAYSFKDYMRLSAAVLFGKATGGATTNIKFKDPPTGSTNRINETVDANGNRISVTLNPD